MTFNLQDTFNRELPADPLSTNERRQVFEACYSFVSPRKPSDGCIIHTSKVLARNLGISETDLLSDAFRQIMTGEAVLPDTQPYAMCYGGHQFGQWAGQLGDGRAINLFEIVHGGQRWALQLKGAGETPYSRSADGLAVLRSSIREHLCSEAMFHLGVPTTRSLSLALTGDQVLRDVLYNGNPAYEKGAVVCRVAPSFIRFGNFQLPASRRDTQTLKALTDYTIRYFYPEITDLAKAGYLQFLETVMDRTIEMIVHWQRVGFVHGVMNTDNMSILGLTIDYGPYGWLEGYDPGWTPNTTDASGRRYRFGNQPPVAFWNVLQLANALHPLVEDVPALEAILEQFRPRMDAKLAAMRQAKLGLAEAKSADTDLITQLENALILAETDMTIFYRLLANVQTTQSPEAAFEVLQPAFYDLSELNPPKKALWLKWIAAYLERLADNGPLTDDAARKEAMNTVNPKYVLRNYMAQLAIDAADKGDYSLIDELYTVLQNPYAEQPSYEKWFAKRPEWARHKVGCSMLSCSS